ncbi:MAG: PASTA domain-containing protein, partial [bacterium]
IPLPDVTKMLYEDARARLVSEGFNIIREEERYDSVIPAGYVIEQNPKGGALVKSGRRVYVILSRGEQKIPVPELTDISEREAKLKLQRLGLSIGTKTYEPSNYYFENVVMHQSIAAGVETSRGTRIDLTISIGDVADEIAIPLVEGRTLDDAKEKLAQKGIKIGTITYQEMASLLPETVIKQSITAGTVISRADSVDLVVSMLPRGGVND